MDAEKWRRDLVKDITKKISSIHNASLGEHRIREINDEINKMNRQKHFWEARIRELGGNAIKGRLIDVEGKELPGAPGYKYYGAAKDLPGVRELFAEKSNEVNSRQQKRSRGDLYKNITPDYYGYRDDDDGILQEKESIREAELLREADIEFEERRQAVIEKVKAAQRARINGEAEVEGGALTAVELALLENNGSDDDEEESMAIVAITSTATATESSVPAATSAAGPSATTDAGIKSHVAVPSLQDMNSVILEEKKKLMLQRLMLA